MPFSLPRLLSKIQSIITLDTANNNLVLANSLVFPDGTRQTTAGVAVDAFARTTANGANGLAQGAYNQANTATGIAQAAFNSANNVFPQIQPAWNTANTAYNNTLYLQSVNNAQNTTITAVNNFAGAAFNTANNVNDHIALVEGVDLTQNAQITAVNQYATSAYNTANTGAANIIVIQGVDLAQNTRLTNVEFLAQFARDTANNAVANTIVHVGIDNTQNTRLNSIESVNNTQNVAIGVIQGTSLTQNTRLDGIEGTNLTQNTNITSVNQFAQSAYNTANTNVTNITYVNNFAQSAYNTANTNVTNITAVNGYATSAYNQANVTVGVDATQNSSISIIQGVDLTQNTRLDGIEGTNVTQNTRISSIEFINNIQNTAIGIIQGTNITQNTNITAVNQFAQSAYDKANNALPLSGGTLTGPLTISGNNDLTVTGNLYVTGTNFVSNTQSFTLIDPLIKLGLGNYTSDAVDIGFVAHYNDGANAHTGLFRDFGTKEYYFFKGYTPEVDANNNVNINHASFSTANLNASFFKGNLIATTAIINGRDSQSINDTQNTNITSINQYAVSAYDTANTNVTNIGIIQGVNVTQNTNITSVNQYAASAYAAGNTNATNITAVNNYATSAYNQANVTAGGLVTANSNISIIQGVNAWQNTQITYVNQFAQAAFTKANTGVSSSNTFITVNANSSIINASSNTDTLTIMPGNNITFVTDTVNKKITISTSITAVTIPTLLPSRASFVAASAQTSIAVAHTTPYVYVSINGITVDPSEYTANGTHVVLTTPLRIGDVVDVTGYTSGTSTVQAIKGDKGDIGSFTSNTALYATDLYSTGNVITSGDVRAAGGSVSLNDTYINTVFLQNINNTQNTNITSVNNFAQSSYNVANSASANTIITQGVDVTQNAAITVLQGVNTTQNTNITAVNQFAQSSYDTANTKFNTSGGTITGSVTISGNNNLTVTGNLFVTGTQFVSNTQSFATTDPLLKLGLGNYTSDAVDIGFAAHYNDGANAHTGLFRDYGTKEYYFFKGYIPEVDSNNNINISHSSFSTSNVNASFFKGNIIGLSVNTANAYISTSLGVGTVPSNVVGEIRAANNILSYYTSDKQFKENIVDIPNALDKVDAIGGKLFDWTDSYLDNHGGVDDYYVRKNDFGVIAQDVQAVFSVAVRSKPDGTLAVDYEKLSALAFAAIKELKKEIDELKGKK